MLNFLLTVNIIAILLVLFMLAVVLRQQPSEARGLGAVELGELFYQLELAGRGKDTEKIKEVYPAALASRKKVSDSIDETFRKFF